MSNFTPTVVGNFIFDGDNVVIEMSRLSRTDVMALAALTDQEGNVNQDEAIKLGAECLQRCIVSMKGLMDAARNPIDIDVMLNAGYFMQLQTEAMEFLFLHSQLSEKDIKNSGVQPSTSKEAQALSEEKSSEDSPASLGQPSSSSASTNHEQEV